MERVDPVYKKTRPEDITLAWLIKGKPAENPNVNGMAKMTNPKRQSLLEVIVVEVENIAKQLQLHLRGKLTPP